jgi:hypothetical protein
MRRRGRGRGMCPTGPIGAQRSSRGRPMVGRQSGHGGGCLHGPLGRVLGCPLGVLGRLGMQAGLSDGQTEDGDDGKGRSKRRDRVGLKRRRIQSGQTQLRAVRCLVLFIPRGVMQYICITASSPPSCLHEQICCSCSSPLLHSQTPPPQVPDTWSPPSVQPRCRAGTVPARVCGGVK